MRYTERPKARYRHMTNEELPESDQPDIGQPTLPPCNESLENPTIPPACASGNDATLPPKDPYATAIGEAVRHNKSDTDATLASRANAGEAIVGYRIKYFGDYDLLEEIARGGMGVVYKARQTSLNRLVALKMILAGQFAGAEDVQRFYTEAEAAAQLDHPGIVPIHEIGEHQGQHYFSMGYVDGESLAHKVADSPLPPREAAKLVKEVCEAMAYAHERGVIHRDLKPANILIGLDGKPKVTDFGLAKKTEADSNLTGTGQILGTPSYMPPEQASGNGDAVGPLADVYSLGAILYCLLTGRPPFQAASPMDTLMQVLEKEPIALQTLNPETPRDLQTICLKCLNKVPTRRYANVLELQDELQRFLDHRPIQARPIGTVGRAVRWCRREPVVAVLLTLCAATLVAGTIVSTAFAIRSDRNAHEAHEKARESERNLYLYSISQLPQIWIGDWLDEGRIRRILRDTQPQEKNALDWRGFEWYYWNRNLNFQVKTLSDQSFNRVLCFPISGLMAAASHSRGEIALWHPGEALQTLSIPNASHGTLRPSGSRANARHYCYSIDLQGNRIAAVFSSVGESTRREPGTTTQVVCWDTRTAKQTNAFEIYRGANKSEDPVNIALSPDGETIAICKRSEETEIWRTRKNGTAERINTVKSPIDYHAGTLSGERATRLAEYTWIGFTSQGHLIVCDHGDVNLVDPITGQVLAEVGDQSGSEDCGFHLTPSGDRIRLSDGSVFDLHTGERLVRLKTTGSGGCFSSDGRRFATSAGVWNVETGNLEFSNRLGFGDGFAFTLTGHQIVTADRDGLRVWDCQLDSEGDSIPIPFQGKLLSVSPSGESAIVAGHNPEDGTDICVVDCDTGQTRVTIKKAHHQRINSLMFSPKGDSFASAGHSPQFKVTDGEFVINEGKPDEIKFWDVATGDLISTLRPDCEWISGIDISNDGTSLAAYCRYPRDAGSFDSRRVKSETGVGVWNLKSGEMVRFFPCSVQAETISIERSRGRCRFSPDGSMVAAIDELWETVEVSRLDSGDTVFTHRESEQPFSLKDFRFHPDGVHGVINIEAGLTVFDLRTRREVWTLDESASTGAFTLSPDGQRVVADCGGVTKFWDFGSGLEVLRLKPMARGLTFSSDGRRLVGVDEQERAIRVWDAHSVTESDRRRRESLGLARFVFARSKDANNMKEALQSNEYISDRLRDDALRLVDRFYQ